MGWPTGLEPATTRITIWGSTIELRPPTWGETLRIGLWTVKNRPAHGLPNWSGSRLIRLLVDGGEMTPAKGVGVGSS